MRLIIIAICLLAAATAKAQDTTGTISGTIINTQEQPIAGAEVSIYNNLGIRAFTTTNNKGQFITNKIDTGLYEVNVRYRAHKRSIITNVPVKPRRNAEIHVKLFEQTTSWDTIAVFNPYNIVAVEPLKPLAPVKTKKAVPKKVKK